MRVAPGAACLEGQRFCERDGGRIGVDREHVLPAKAEGRADNLAGEGNPRFEPRRGRLPRLKGHGLTNLAGRFKGLFESGSGTLAGLVPNGERPNLPKGLTTDSQSFAARHMVQLSTCYFSDKEKRVLLMDKFSQNQNRRLFIEQVG